MNENLSESIAVFVVILVQFDKYMIRMRRAGLSREPVQGHWARRWAWALQLRAWLCSCCALSVSLPCPKHLIIIRTMFSWYQCIGEYDYLVYFIFVYMLTVVIYVDLMTLHLVKMLPPHICEYVNVTIDDRLQTWTCQRQQDQCLAPGWIFIMVLGTT